jgi:RNA polymerase sigma-70 factor (ECF subfamily)
VTQPLEAELEKSLLRAWAQGSRESGEELLRLMLPGIYGLCFRILRRDADAQDAAQETFARMCAEVRKGTEIRDVKKWAATVAMNRSIDMQRARGRETVLEEEFAPAAESADPVDRLDADVLRRWMDALPPRYRTVLHYHFYMDMKPREIAEAMGLEDGTARVLLHRAVAALRKAAGRP